LKFLNFQFSGLQSQELVGCKHPLEGTRWFDLFADIFIMGSDPRFHGGKRRTEVIGAGLRLVRIAREHEALERIVQAGSKIGELVAQ